MLLLLFRSPCRVPATKEHGNLPEHSKGQAGEEEERSPGVLLPALGAGDSVPPAGSLNQAGAVTYIPAACSPRIPSSGRCRLGPAGCASPRSSGPAPGGSPGPGPGPRRPTAPPHSAGPPYSRPSPPGGSSWPVQQQANNTTEEVTSLRLRAQVGTPRITPASGTPPALP